jgi:hypothetical protein
LAQWLFASTLPRHPVVTSGANVRFWHKADMDAASIVVA